jgi:glycosyltransferase involved in cell wall biosynthesis
MRVPDISVIVTAHREGAIAAATLRSCRDGIAEAERIGLGIETIAVLDRADDATRAVFAGLAAEGRMIAETDFGDQGLARNAGVRHARGTAVAFLDADDLWSRNWLTAAWAMFAAAGPTAIVHPEFDLFFGGSRDILVNVDQTDPSFDPEFLRFGNYWDALCLAPREAYARFPFSARDIEAGFAYEDWHWNCETLAAGFVHRVALGTIHFKRRRAGSQTLEAGSRRALPRRTALHSYGFVPPRPTPT